MGNKYKGPSVWINKETGEEIVADEIEKQLSTNKRQHAFMITYLTEIINLMETLGNKKMQVVKYMLSVMDLHNNTILMTGKEISEKSGIGYNTVVDTLKLLEESQIIKRKPGVILFNPQLINNKRASGEAAMMIRYKNFDKEEEN